jgi:hypothetical protein
MVLIAVVVALSELTQAVGHPELMDVVLTEEAPCLQQLQRTICSKWT